ncbi:toll/interleukin-1 receptor domain-containing protein [Henriciella sp.]|uniref:toll/interleukin-1 receptor domain-containing protein n=1 Tax=Henriciella sp. TaxID=1968823 RepID=UPI00260F242D|nr:toll/interleukin-1 receptor domain-containing protein [Henriciella sp.]
MKHDVFISHASEDKTPFVREFAAALVSKGIHVWYDEFSLKLGDSLSESIDHGLAHSQFGIVVLSPSFFAKKWPRRELQGLVARQMSGDSKVIIPIWHGLTYGDVLKYSPPLADTFAANSAEGVEALTEKIIREIRPTGSPLSVAHEILSSHGLELPPLSDIWWISLIEHKEREFKDPHLNSLSTPWMFPLPNHKDWTSQERGENIASTALQLDWIAEAWEFGPHHLSHPDKVHDFILKWPGLLDTVRRYPEVLAIYAPQLTIPGYDSGFEQLFDELLEPANKCAYAMPGYGGPPETTDGRPPLCGELIAWRHPTFGNYSPGELASSFVSAHTGNYYREWYTGIQCLFWLLSSSSEWMPENLKQQILTGFHDNPLIWEHRLEVVHRNNVFVSELYSKTPSRFSITRKVKSGLEDLVSEMVEDLELADSVEALSDRFLKGGFIRSFHKVMYNRR